VGGSNSSGGLYPDGGCYNTCWLTGIWSTQAKVEGIVLKVAWHWGRDSSVINDPLQESARTPLYVVLLSASSSVDGELMFSLYVCKRALFGGLWQTI